MISWQIFANCSKWGEEEKLTVVIEGSGWGRGGEDEGAALDLGPRRTSLQRSQRRSQAPGLSSMGKSISG